MLVSEAVHSQRSKLHQPAAQPTVLHASAASRLSGQGLKCKKKINDKINKVETKDEKRLKAIEKTVKEIRQVSDVVAGSEQTLAWRFSSSPLEQRDGTVVAMTGTTTTVTTTTTGVASAHLK